MIEIYELAIRVGDEIEGFSIEHRFPCLPEVETIVALRNEALMIHSALFPEDTTDAPIGVSLYFIPREERDTEQVSDRAPTS